MSQHDLNIGNETHALLRADLNSALVALGSSMQGDEEPPVTFAGMLWFDTSGAETILRARNSGDTAWIAVITISTTNQLIAAANVMRAASGDLLSFQKPDGTQLATLGGNSGNFTLIEQGARIIGDLKGKWVTGDDGIATLVNADTDTAVMTIDAEGNVVLDKDEAQFIGDLTGNAATANHATTATTATTAETISPNALGRIALMGEAPVNGGQGRFTVNWTDSIGEVDPRTGTDGEIALTADAYSVRWSVFSNDILGTAHGSSIVIGEAYEIKFVADNFSGLRFFRRPANIDRATVEYLTGRDINTILITLELTPFTPPV